MAEYILDYNIFWETLGGTLFIFFCTLFLLYSSSQKIIYTAFTAFYYLYSGLGISYVKGVHPDFQTMYFTFFIALSITFYISGKLFLTEARHFRKSVMPFLQRFTSNKALIYSIIGFFLFASFLPLLYPEFKVHRIFSPPSPNVADQFFQRVAERKSGSVNPLLKIMNNISFLIYPFFLIALSYFRKQPFKLFLFLFIPLYFHYCNISYINRGKVLETLFIFFTMLWYFSPQYRKKISVFLFIVLPLLPVALLNYAEIRGGSSDTLNITASEAVGEIVHAESTMPTFSKKIIKSQRSLNLRHYFLWMTTLPIPKAIIGPVPLVSAGVEMSEILLGKKMGQEGYYALLAGLVNESVHTYGKRWYWLHGVMIGFFMAFAARFTEGNHYLFPVLLVFSVLFSYVINRAGFASAFAPFVNRFFSMYIILGFFYFRKRFRLN